jgi:hypothetical protein
MNKVFFFMLCFVMFFSCKKEKTSQASESSSQLLRKVIFSSDGLSYPVASYQYNSEGKIIAEGNKTYIRDGQQRIVEILDPGTLTNREDIKVYYSTQDKNKVDYTVCKMADGVKDSVQYIRDNSGRMVKAVSYVSYSSSSLSPDTTLLSHYDTYAYSQEGNLIRIDLYNINHGQVSLCGRYNFSGYDKMINPQFSDDEVRTIQYYLDGTMNASKNNFASGNGYFKTYEYRADGRPRFCTVQKPGAYTFKLIFEYQ